MVALPACRNRSEVSEAHPYSATSFGDLILVRELVEALETAGIRYCHFKSTEGLEQAMSGRTDLDLLVDPSQKFDFSRMAVRLGFKKAATRTSKLPGVDHFYGCDASTGVTVDLHVHFRLIIGSDVLKNYELPTAAYLDSSVESTRGIRIPAVEHEYVLFVLRMVLKRRLLPWLLGYPDPRVLPKTLLARRHPPLRSDEARELAYLESRIDADKVSAARTAIAPAVDAALFALCEKSLRSDAERWEWLRSGRHLCRALAAHRRHRRLASAVRAVISRWRFLVPRIRRRLRLDRTRPMPRLDCRGPVIAFVGGDGAGKTTNVRALEASLGEIFDVRTFHLGKPPFGPIRLGFRIASKAIRVAIGNRREADVKPLLAMRYVLIARGRWKLVRSLHDHAGRGGVVICDRYPLAALALSEGPLVASLYSGHSRQMAWLDAAERRYYDLIREFPEPDLIIVLSIDPAISIGRRPEDDPEFIKPRLEEIRDLSWDDNDRACVIDASRPIDAVLAEVRDEAWKTLPGWAPRIEVAGPAGSGKSTLVGHLLEGGGFQAERVPTLRRQKLRSGLVALSLPWAPFRVGLRMARWIVTKQVLLNIWSSRVPPTPAPVLFDQGPYFTLAFARWLLGSRFERTAVRQWHRRYLERASDLIDVVVRLDAPDTQLRARLETRSQDHMVKAAGPDVQSRFLEISRQHLDDALIDDMGECRFSVISLRSDDIEPSKLAREIRAALGGHYV